MTYDVNRLLRLAGAALSACCIHGLARAAPPNDDWADRTVVAGLPFSETLPDVQDATTESTDPNIFCYYAPSGPSNPGRNSVWYGYATGDADEYVDLDATGYDTILAVYEGAPASFVGVRAGCNDDGAGRGSGSIIRGLRLRAHTPYSIVVARYAPDEGDATLSFSMARSAVYRVTKTEDGDDGRCDEDCSLREAVRQSVAVPGAVLIPAGRYPVPGGLDFGNPNPGGENLYGAGMNATVIDAMGDGRVLTYPFQEGTRQVLTHGLHDLTLTNANFDGNGGAVYGAEGYFVFDRVALTDSVARINGGGANIQLSAASFYESLIAGNTAEGNGGGLYVRRHNLEIRDSTIIGNRSRATAEESGGGGLYLTERFSELRLTNTTIGANQAAADAGGLYVLDAGNDVELDNASIVGNAFAGAQAASRAGGLLVDGSSRVRIGNSVLSGNHVLADEAATSDCGAFRGASATTHHNLVGAPGSCTFSSSDLIGPDPQLLPLGPHDSRLPVYVPAPGSPLVDAGDPGDSCAPADARGVARPLDGDGDGVARCDIGAVELRPAADAIFADGFD